MCSTERCEDVKNLGRLNSLIWFDMGVSENVVYPIVPNGFADHYPVFKWLAIIGKINPIFKQTHIG